MTAQGFLEGYMNKTADWRLDYESPDPITSGIASTATNTAIGGAAGGILGATLGRDDSETLTEAAGRGALRGAGYGLGSNVVGLGTQAAAETLGADPTTSRIAKILGALTGGLGGYALARGLNKSPQEEAEDRLREEAIKKGLQNHKESVVDREEQVQALMSKLRQA